MIPEWMKESEPYIPQTDRSTFAVKTIARIGGILSRIQIQNGQEKAAGLPAVWRLVLVIVCIGVLSASRGFLVLLAFAAAVQLRLCLMKGKTILSILKGALSGGVITLILFLPAMLMKPEAMENSLHVVLKVFLSLEMLGVFNHTTQWNHITGAMRKLHIPAVFIFTLDLSIKYIVLLGNLLEKLLTALQLRSVGKNRRKYSSVGGVMGVTFVRSVQMSRETYEAMECRGFTDEYSEG